MPGGMLELHELKVFLVAAETENFSQTGRILQMSQPAVSGHIQALETRLKIRLFDRTGRNIKLNEIGQALVPVARNLLKEAQRVEEFVASQQGTLIGKCTVGCSTAAGKYFLPKIMARFMDCYPEVRMICQVGMRGHALDRLALGEVDLAVSSLRIPRSGIEYRHFADDLLVLIAPLGHPWAQVGSIAPKDLLEYPFVLREASSGTSITLNRELGKFDMSLDMLQTCLIIWNTEAIVQAVIAGVGPAFVSRISAELALTHGMVVEVPVEGLRLVLRLYMARHMDFQATEAQKAFWNFTFSPDNKDLRQFFT
jgi:DNA-binding transcriptional LysR family regulator